MAGLCVPTDETPSAALQDRCLQKAHPCARLIEIARREETKVMAFADVQSFGRELIMDNTPIEQASYLKYLTE
ncbi:hypothetical protein ANN_16404 [Periplaneta americana]|uniref:Uncharacterized protein n=1 Tax=Periplaneta americana TaxID=6978 RepID=A0ABQ8SIW7_PERAM|nr:hypothetical protein ANN_16404 [Periplaneta americana]